MADQIQHQLDSEIVKFHLFVPGKPAPQGSKRHVGHGILVESSKAVAPWRTLVAWSVAQSWTTPPALSAVTTTLEFVMPRPAGTPKNFTPPATKRPDLDKLERAIFDALTGVCWKDDSQIVDAHTTKRLAEINELPGVHISIVWEY
jgi:crossover junction endodeoxyribonuclease RusA